MNRKALVTGGGGLIGSHVVDQLLDPKGAFPCSEIVVLDNFVRGSRDNLKAAMATGRVELIEGDIRDRDAVARAIRGADYVFHLAAIRITQCAEEPRLALEVMVDGTFNVIEASKEAGAKKIILSSSASVYGLAEQFPTTESHHPYNNRTFYGAAKAFNEGMLRSFNDMYGLPYVALRYFNVYGPRMDIHGVYTEVLVRWMDRLREGKAPLIFGDGKQTMDFIYAEDIATANLLAAASDASDETFNIARGEEISLNDLANTLARVMGSSLTPEYGEERKVNPVPRRLADTSKAERMLGFHAKTDLETGLRNLVEWWNANKLTPAQKA